ncbi:type II toxin-antitoxin system RelE/ParE family toxin [Rhizobium tubonense]|uniref:Plasmid stabilization protein n=1 Tax=Rhizobium tubonense TaxID=484088 RepID=A0A2W4CLY9_9HYPH|nr:type II toxin-antitoxin system RelE/ParE family toxin [Rhizobium tubonense]PZM13809.1 hypothetical protein CPY51_13130 [Rhizobium tubonense]
MRLTIQPAARADVLKQMQHYSEVGREDVAERFFNGIRQSIDEMMLSPNAGSPRQFDSAVLAGMRSWPIKGFDAVRIYYLANQDVVTIVRILHGRRDVEGIFDSHDEDL